MTQYLMFQAPRLSEFRYAYIGGGDITDDGLKHFEKQKEAR